MISQKIRKALGLHKERSEKADRVLILGLGCFSGGSGISSAEYFAKAGAEVLVTDLKTAKALKENVARLKRYPNVRFRLGSHRLSDVDWADVVVKNPDVPRTSEMYRYASQLGKPIVNDVVLFLQQCPALVVGVTGTRGKSTTASWIADMLKRSGKRVHLGGNITVSPLTFLSRVRKDDVVVLELSSWLLETCGENGLSPRIAVWTNVLPDHLNRYDGMEDYAEAKAQIMRHQRRSDLFIPNLDDAVVRSYVSDAVARVRGFSFRYRVGSDTWIENGGFVLKKGKKQFSVLNTQDIGLQGLHNQQNALSAILAASSAGATLSGIRHSLRLFQGVPYRQELVATIDGVRYINDTTSTTPDAAIAALDRFTGTVHWICGGSDKGLDFDAIARHAGSKRDLHIYLLEGSGSDRLRKAFDQYGVSFQRFKTLSSAFSAVRKRVTSSDTVLLSPACSSFGMFVNEFDRGDQFNVLVQRIR